MVGIQCLFSSWYKSWPPNLLLQNPGCTEGIHNDLASLVTSLSLRDSQGSKGFLQPQGIKNNQYLYHIARHSLFPVLCDLFPEQVSCYDWISHRAQPSLQQRLQLFWLIMSNDSIAIKWKPFHSYFLYFWKIYEGNIFGITQVFNKLGFIQKKILINKLVHFHQKL